MVPMLFSNMRRALVPLLHDDTYKVMYAVAQAVENAGRNPRNKAPENNSRKHRQYDGIEAANIQLPQRKRQEPTRGQSQMNDNNSSGRGAVETADSMHVDPQDGGDDDNEDPVEANTNNISCENGGLCIPCFELA
jgi:hypothetical protein